MQLVTKTNLLTFLNAVRTALQTRNQLQEVVDVLGDMYMMDASSNLAGDTVEFMLCNIGNVTKEQLQDIHALITLVSKQKFDLIGLLHESTVLEMLALVDALSFAEVLEYWNTLLLMRKMDLKSQEHAVEFTSSYKI
jgi:hypothetical protein